MASISYKNFTGETPRAEPHQLPNDGAQQAVDCDFAGGALRPIQDGLLLRSGMGSNPVRGIYTDDGINFYTWNQETQAFRSPVIDDAYSRVYYLTPAVGTFRATTRGAMTSSGPTPLAANYWTAGVPRPTVAPTLQIVQRTTLPDYSSVSITAESWWEDSAGKTYGRAAAQVTTVTALLKYTIAKQTEPTQADPLNPVTYRPAAKITFTETLSGTEIMSATVRPGSTARSSSLPGGVEFSAEEQSTSTALTVTMTWGVVETRAYTFTCRNTWEEEGAPAPAATIAVTYIQDVRVTMTAPSFPGYRPFNEYQVYRTFGSTATYLPIDGGSATATITDTSRKPFANGEALQSSTWTPAPTGLQGLELMPNGWFAAFKGNMLYMSEPFRPHAWPYNMTFPTAIRGIKVTQQSMVVTTMDGVYIVAGAVPAAAQQMKLNSPQPGIAQRSMAGIDGAVAYASNDGFILVSGSSASPEISQKFFDRKTWRSRFGTQLSNASMRFAYHDGALLSVSDTESNGFLLRMDEDAGSFTRLDSRYDALFQLPVNDALYYSIGSSVYQFRGGANKSFDWWGKDFIFPQPVGFGAGYIRCTGTVTLTLYADGVAIRMKPSGADAYTLTLTSGHFRLPAVGRFLRWSVRLQGSGTVNEFAIASSMGELQGV